MNSVRKQTASRTNTSRSSCQHFEALEGRQMLSATVPHIPVFLPEFLNDTQVHADTGHGAKGNTAIKPTLANTQVFSKTQIVYTPIHFPFPFPTLFIEPKVNGSVTQWHNFSGNPLFAPGGPSPNDVVQGQVGDCWFVATLAETALRDPTTIQNTIHQRADGTYDVYFHTSPTATIDEHVDGSLPENYYGGLEYAQLGQDGCTWVAIIEKALTYFRNRSIAADYNTINNGWGREAMSDLGATPSEVLPSVSNSAQFFTDVLWGLILGTGMDFGTKGSGGGPLVNSHEYSVVSARVQNGVDQIEVRNPWGYNPNYVHGSSNYDATNDGYMWVDASAVYSELDEFVSASV